MHDAMQLDRRRLLQRAALLIGAASIPYGQLLAATAEGGKPSLLPPQMELLGAVADTLVPVTDTPGALAANVPALLDKMLSEWASPESRTAIITALDNIEAAARVTAGTSFVAMPAASRKEFLQGYDRTALKPVPGKVDEMSPLPPVADPGYAKLKELIVVLYYQSEIALTTELTYEHAPGKWLPSIPITPETRQTGGAGLY